MNINPENNNPSDLIKSAQAGDSVAFDALYNLYFVPVYRYIYFRVRSKE